MPEPMSTQQTDRINTPLLTLITQQSLDEDYLHVAERKACRERDGTRWTAPAVSVGVLHSGTSGSGVVRRMSVS